MFLGILGLLLFLSSIVWLVISLFKRKGAKKPLIAIATGFVLFVVGVSLDTSNDEQTSSKENDTSEVAEKAPEKKEEKADKEVAKKEKESADKEAEAAKEAKKEEKVKAEAAAKEKANAEKKAKAESEAKVEADAKAAAAKTKEELKDPSTYKTDITYDQVARTPDDYMLEKVMFSGKVVQVMEGDSTTNQLRVAINDNYDTIMLVEYEKDILDSRILEDDYIKIYGYSMGVMTYESTLGGNITIPAMSANIIQY